MKWVMDYNMNFITHLAYVVNAEKIWAHQGEVYPTTSSMLPITKAGFAHVIQLVDVKCKPRCLTHFHFLIQCIWILGLLVYGRTTFVDFINLHLDSFVVYFMVKLVIGTGQFVKLFHLWQNQVSVYGRPFPFFNFLMQAYICLTLVLFIEW